MNKIILVILSCISVINNYCAAEDHLRALKERIGVLGRGYRCEEGEVYESPATAMDAYDFKTNPDSMPTCELFILFGHDTQAAELFEQLNVFDDCLKHKNDSLAAIIRELQSVTQHVARTQWMRGEFPNTPKCHEWLLNKLAARRAFLAQSAKRMVQSGAVPICESRLPFGCVGALWDADPIEGELKKLWCPDSRIVTDIIVSRFGDAHRSFRNRLYTPLAATVPVDGPDRVSSVG